MRLRQIVIASGALEPAVSELRDVLGVRVCYRDPRVARWGLENAIMPVTGGEFIEALAPVKENTAVGRFLARRGGSGCYMLVLQCRDAYAERARITALGVRSVWTADRPEYRATQFHPSDLGGIFLTVDSVPPEFDYRSPTCPWPPAGPAWTPAADVAPAAWAPADRGDVEAELVGVALESADPAGLCELWSRVLALPARRLEAEHRIELLNGALRFTQALDGRGAGVTGFDLGVPDRSRVLRAASARGLEVGPRHFITSGARVNLVEPEAR